MKERRKRRSAKDIKESIINAATHLIETEGFSNLTVIQVLCDKLKLSLYNSITDMMI